MTFGELQTEFFARGFEYLSDGGAGLVRAKRWLNDAMHEINDFAPWPYLEATVASTSPVTFTDLRQVLSVIDTSTRSPLMYLDRRTAQGSFADLTQIGPPTYWYFEPSGTSDVIKTYPVSASDTITIRYVRVEPDLSASSDTPLMPGRFHRLIVDSAVAEGYEDSDNFMPAYVLQTRVDAELQRMMEQLMVRNYDSTDQVVRTQLHEGFSIV